MDTVRSQEVLNRDQFVVRRAGFLATINSSSYITVAREYETY